MRIAPHVHSLTTAVCLAALAAGCSDGPTEPAGIDINWSNSAREFRGQTGAQLTFNCPADGTADLIWGTAVYTDDSSICTAGVHVGAITLDGGGQVTIEIRPAESSYRSTMRNGITSASYGSYGGSFIVL